MNGLGAVLVAAEARLKRADRREVWEAFEPPTSLRGQPPRGLRTTVSMRGRSRRRCIEASKEFSLCFAKHRFIVIMRDVTMIALVAINEVALVGWVIV